MKRFCVSVIALCLLGALVRPAHTFDRRGREKRIKREWARDELLEMGLSIPEGRRPHDLTRSAQVDTYTIVRYDFEGLDWQGWTQVDNTSPVRKCFWHVDDFSGLDGWDPLEGTQSMWCGARPDPDDPYMCSWVTAPGYGDNWDQSFVSDPFDTDNGTFTLAFHGRFDTEPVYDWISVDYDKGSG
jgi:hypothetical protein